MAESKEREKSNKFIVGPGLGLIIMGLAYLIWWLLPWGWEAYGEDPRWAHNWAYAIIILTIGLAWYHKSVISRIIAAIQSFMMPVTASGSFNTLLLAFITVIIAVIWCIVVLIELIMGKKFLQETMSKRAWNWINMHSIIVSWILIAHMGLVFLIGRAPQEAQLLALGTDAGFLVNLPPENHELATWFFGISLIIWAIIVLYEQYKLGYNLQNKPWPRLSFYWAFICMGSGLLGIAITSLL